MSSNNNNPIAASIDSILNASQVVVTPMMVSDLFVMAFQSSLLKYSKVNPVDVLEEEEEISEEEYLMSEQMREDQKWDLWNDQGVEFNQPNYSM
jgi:hypothetical protein